MEFLKMAEIKAGGTVQLKSGGPTMTVESIKQIEGVMTAWCQWFDGNKPMANRFHVSSLEIVG
jgi:uncharacterized protein YodC (DUF2158 family)